MAPTLPSQADIVIVGAGIVGLAAAFRLSERVPDTRIVVLEKEARIASHQTGNNSGVIHSGIYYRPGSLKAINCTRGKEQLERFCEESGIPFKRIGKLLIASKESELAALDELHHRGTNNGLQCRYMTPEEMREHEPGAAGLKALFVPEAGIVDFRLVCRALADRLAAAGVDIILEAEVIGGQANSKSVVIQTSKGHISADTLVNCAGLYCDKIASMFNYTPSLQIVPFRGEYYSLSPEASHLCKGLLYPVPNLSFPFLEVHLTRKIDGSVECGPNAVLAFAREGYRKSDINFRELTETLRFPGFRRLAMQYYQQGVKELVRSCSKYLFLKSLQKLVPEIRLCDLQPGGAGVRAQAVSQDGRLIDDFCIEQSNRVIHVLNAPSPAATSALNIGNHIADLVHNAQ